MRLWRSSSLVLLVTVLIQIAFLQSGLLGTCLEKITAICQCNHGSRKEVHANPEDSRFKAKKGISAKQSNVSATVLPNCHSAKNGETHACSCSKKKERFSELKIQSQIWNTLFDLVSISSKQDLLYSLNEPSLPLRIGQGLSLDRPPKV